VLRRALKGPRQSYDVILIDCPPALGLLTVNGLVASDWAIVSAEAQYFALQGVQGALDVVEQAKEYYNPDLELAGVLMNIADMRTVHSRDAYDTLAEHFPDSVFKTVIRSSIAYAESAEKARSILDHRPDLGADYLALADEVLKRIGLDAPRRKLRPLGTAAG
jgi:chromosome partitioning protein